MDTSTVRVAGSLTCSAATVSVTWSTVMPIGSGSVQPAPVVTVACTASTPAVVSVRSEVGDHQAGQVADAGRQREVGAADQARHSAIDGTAMPAPSGPDTATVNEPSSARCTVISTAEPNTVPPAVTVTV